MIEVTEKDNKKLLEKLFKIGQETSKVPKNADNPYYESKYTDLNTILDMLNPILEKHRLQIIQLPFNDGLMVGIETSIIDLDSEGILTTKLTFPANNAQKGGSAITYARRYSLVAMFNLQSVDDDGQGAIPTQDEIEIMPIKKEIDSLLNCKEVPADKRANFKDVTNWNKQTWVNALNYLRKCPDIKL
jgi:hypothetical protein